MQMGQAQFSTMEEAYAEAINSIGAKLFTVSAVNADRTEVIRIFTSNERVYPRLGVKPAGDLRVSMEQGTTLHPTKGQILELFPDHDVILALGCTAAINVPVIADGHMIGSVNFLDEEGNYTAVSVPKAEEISARLQNIIEEHVAQGL